jgi:hypothetical protein
MKKIIYFLLILFIISIKSQETNKDTLPEKITDIESVIINDKDYEKIDYSFALKKEINYGLGAVNPNISAEMGLRFNNNLGQKGRISNIILFLYKTKKEYKLADLEINIYKIDPLTNKPFQKLNTEQIIYTPTTWKANNISIDVKKYNIPFPEDGVVVTVKWLPVKEYHGLVGPAIRFTNYTERLTYTRYNNDDSKWGNGPDFSKKNGLYTNVMIGIDVYVKKKKRE